LFLLQGFKRNYFDKTPRVIESFFRISGKLNYALNSGVKSIVSSSSDIIACNDFSAALTDDDLARIGNLPCL